MLFLFLKTPLHTPAEGDDDMFHTYFNDMVGTSYRLYEFTRVAVAQGSDKSKDSDKDNKVGGGGKRKKNKKKKGPKAPEAEALPF